MIALLNVDAIATDADLALELGGVERLNSTQKDVAVRDANRASALQDVLLSLATRTPPVYASSLSDATELKNAVVYRALAKICAYAMTGNDVDRNAALTKRFEANYQEAVRARFSVSAGQQSAPSGWSFHFERR